MKIKASITSHKGKILSKNEDNFCFDGWIRKREAAKKAKKYNIKKQNCKLFGIFDGMGGISAGEVASLLCAKTAKSVKINADDIKKGLLDVCTEANLAVCAESQKIKAQMGSTASMLCFKDGEFCLCNIGDSPIFLLRNGELNQISAEHTEKETFKRLYGEDSPKLNRKFKLTQHIGIDPNEMTIEPYCLSGNALTKDRFLICSDGLTDMVDSNTVKDILVNTESPQKAVSALLLKAIENGGKDNITIMIIDIIE